MIIFSPHNSIKYGCWVSIINSLKREGSMKDWVIRVTYPRFYTIDATYYFSYREIHIYICGCFN